jgi:leucyl aminopeptidase
LSIKSSDAMTSMRTDMTGAAAALAAVLAAARERLPVAVTAVLAIAENSVGEGSYRPGDVLTIWGGRTVEIANTDAEGRVVLADALGWACATLAPDVIIDLATLTGAATLGLGRGHAALFTTDDDVAAQLTTAGVDSGERVWRLPLVEDYATVVKSTIAGLAHIAPDGRFGGGGAIAAALFLREVVAPQAAAGPAWAHLDIAGPARSEAVSHEIGKGPTGFGARLLVRWLQQMSAGR